ncbi:hypothetical protein DT304_05600 [Lactobacillus reuteri]|uniref:hypothetical protein n=1 Tax=Limosilactobacillus reuteri TaxID=1598 RepID=UPI0016523EA0|nr:hypothetical protein [Limosilactobacillus reuteri]MBC6910742.1 hypothetical protein [Limosilactobacillus reuteri]
MDIRKINTLNGIKEGFITVLDTKKLSECTTNDIVNSAEISKKLSTTITKINKIFSMKLKMIYWKA